MGKEFCAYKIKDLVDACRQNPKTKKLNYIPVEAVVLESYARPDSYFRYLWTKAGLEYKRTQLALLEMAVEPVKPPRGEPALTKLLAEFIASHPEDADEEVFYAWICGRVCGFSFHLTSDGLDRFLPVKVALEDEQKCGPNITVYSATTPVLSMIGTNLSMQAAAGKIYPAFGRQKEIEQIIEVLLKTKQCNPLLVGPPGVGKSAIVEGLACYIRDNRSLPSSVRDLVIISIDVSALEAGTRYRGEFEERWLNCVREIERNTNIVIFIDEIHRVIKAGATEGSSNDLANMLKPALARGTIRVIGATTPAEFSRYIDDDPAFKDRLDIVEIRENSIDETKAILAQSRNLIEVQAGVIIPPAEIDRIVELSSRFLPGKQPRCAFNLLHRALAKSRFAGKNVLRSEFVEEALASLSRIEIGILRSGSHERFKQFTARLRGEVFGQEEAVEAVCGSIAAAFLEVGPRTGPRGVFCFCGATGTGKTFIARMVAASLFGSEDKLLKLDMGAVKDFDSLTLLTKRLAEWVKINASSVVLLDEIEKAPLAVHDLFLSVLDNSDGCLADSRGERVSCRNTVFVLTTNVVNPPEGAGMIGFSSGSSCSVRREDGREALIQAGFREEFINRIHKIIFFQQLSDEALAGITRRRIIELAADFKKQGFSLNVSNEVIESIVRDAAAQKMGARPIDRLIAERITQPAALEILSGSPLIADADIQETAKRDKAELVSR